MIDSNLTEEELIGSRVQVCNPSHLLFGKAGVITSMSTYGGVIFTVKIDGEGGVTYWYRNEIELESNGKILSGCECGCSAVGSPRHSYYCKLYPEGGYE